VDHPFACTEVPDFEAVAPIDVSSLYSAGALKKLREQPVKGGFRLGAIIQFHGASVKPARPWLRNG
jgi:hypothetical protein